MAEEIVFQTPIGGVPYQDWTIVNYVDLDPGPGILDYRGGNYTYDGHDAIDFTLANFAAMDEGVDIYASLPGTVIAVEDSHPDRCSTENPCSTPGNYIIIDHGDGLITRYFHLRTDSASVAVGDVVDAGETIAEVGSSGNSTDAHLDFAVYDNGNLIEINLPGDKYVWESPMPYAGDVVGSLDYDITDSAPSAEELRERPETVDTFTRGPGITPFMWVHLHGVDEGDSLDFYFRQPDGSEFAHWSWEAPQIRYNWWLAGVELPDEAAVGVWEVEFQHNGSTMITDTFTVVDDAVDDSTLYVSLADKGTVDGISFQGKDILAYDNTTDSWSMHFDGSDVLWGGNVNAFHINDDGSILMSFKTPNFLPGLGIVDDSDIVRFIPTSTGSETAGTYEMYFDGSDVGLTTKKEDIDAIGLTSEGDLVVSTTGNPTLPGLSSPQPQDEDLLLFNHTSLGDSTSGDWELFLDGSTQALSKGTEDIDGTWIDSNGDIYLTTKGAFEVAGLSGEGSDAFIYNQSNGFSSFFNGSENGLAGETIDGFALV
jgi:hypothetical protein